ncbi:MAG TPA: hypothetical protein VMP01_04470 [Pirellulaceae bacterium]|nr:hypothetical protein [Pirellulaceae bacterium]
MSAVSLEQRVAALESELHLLRGQVQSLSSRSPNPNWLHQVAGSMEEFPEWDTVLQICGELREAELANFDKSPAGDDSCSSSTPTS